MTRILISGASGQLGMSIQNIYQDYPLLEFVFKNSEELDITNMEQVKAIFLVGNFDYCLNCAAYTQVEQAESTPDIAFRVNAEGVKNLALACKKNNVSLVHLSTDYVFDGEKGTPYTIYDNPNPINEYGKSKLEGEKFIQGILSNYYIVRTSWLYSDYGKNFYKTVLEIARRGEVLKITDQQTGCPTHALNLARFILERIILENRPFGIYHFTDGKAMTWYDFAKIIVTKNNMNATTKIVRDNNYRSLANRPKYSVLASTEY